MLSKICSKCRIEKRASEYFRDNRRAVGIRCKCKECCKQETIGWRNKNRSEYNSYVAAWRAKNPDRQHATEIKRHYKLAIKDYNKMLTDQSCQCKICGKQHDPTQKRGRLYVDHNHIDGKIRGLICAKCNSAIGYLDHDPKILAKAILYLEA